MEEIWEDDQFLEALDWWEENQSFSTIRAKLGEKGISKDRIDYFIRMIDEYAVNVAYVKHTKRKLTGYIVLGLFMAIFGLIMLLYTYIISEGTFVYITYGLILSGGSIAWVNYKHLQKLNPDIREKRMRFQGIRKPKT